MHQVESVVDVFKRQDMGDQIIDIKLAVHIPIDDFRHIGATARAAKGRSLPLPPRKQLERPRGDFGARFGHADNNPLAPAFMAAFQRLAPALGVAYRSEAHMSELQSLLRLSYAVFCLTKKKL